MEIISIDRIHKYYNQNNMKSHVLKGLSFTVNEGDFVVIMGKSGGGKTTLLNILGLLDDFSSGKYMYNGIDISSMNDDARSTFRSKHMGFIFQQFHLIEYLNVEQNIELPMLYSGIKSKSERTNRIKRVLQQVDLTEKIHYFPNQLSGGQQQRISIARALVNDPKIIFADEPTGALDSSTGIEIINLLIKLNLQGKTIIMVTHNDEFKKYASKLFYIRDGVFFQEERI